MTETPPLRDDLRDAITEALNEQFGEQSADMHDEYALVAANVALPVLAYVIEQRLDAYEKSWPLGWKNPHDAMNGVREELAAVLGVAPATPEPPATVADRLDAAGAHDFARHVREREPDAASLPTHDQPEDSFHAPPCADCGEYHGPEQPHACDVRLPPAHLIGWAISIISNVDAPEAAWPQQTDEWRAAARKWLDEAASLPTHDQESRDFTGIVTHDQEQP